MTLLRHSIHDRLAGLSDATRCRLLVALELHELTVGELCAALQLPQSTVSRHLRILADQDWVTSRADGATRWYRLSTELDDEARDLWALVRGPLLSMPALTQDDARIEAVVAARRTRSEAFFQATGAEWDALRTTLFGARADLTAALALLDPSLVVGDLGCGTGDVTAALAPHVAHVHAIDASPVMLAAARLRVGTADNVTLAEGSLESLPLPDASLDAAMLLFVLHHIADPARALAEVRRVLRPGGRVVIADMREHAHEEYRQQMGHVWLGFSADALTGWLADAGFTQMRHVALPADPAASGPALFTVSARCSA